MKKVPTIPPSSRPGTPTAEQASPAKRPPAIPPPNADRAASPARRPPVIPPPNMNVDRAASPAKRPPAIPPTSQARPAPVGAGPPATATQPSSPQQAQSAPKKDFPLVCPFSAKDHKVQVLFQIQATGINFAECERLRHLRPTTYNQLLLGAQRAIWEMLVDDFDHHIKTDDIWVQFRPGQIQSILINFEESPTPDAARIDDAGWPIRIYAAVRCNRPEDATLIAEALQDFADDELAFSEFLETYQHHTRRLADNSIIEILEMDAPATLLGTVYAPVRGGDRTSTVERSRLGARTASPRGVSEEYYLKIHELPA